MRSITRLLIANRGEIACRIIRTAKRLGIHTVAIYSDVDVRAQHVQLADEAHCVGAAPAAQSYLNQDDILQIAHQTKVDAIHPGYGFLSENAEFAKQCMAQNIIFVGPPASAIAAMGSKSQAKRIMGIAGVPLTKGYHGDEQDAEFLAQQAEEIGYPVMLKASAGGGGKGMRIVHQAHEFDEQLAAAKREAQKSFSDDHMLIETYIREPRHIEVQVFCDTHGQGVYLFDRDCSIQRRHQKIIEEAPAPGLSHTTRQAMGEAAVQAAQAIDYVGAGTVEFLLDSQHKFYFMEMNTRLQVEHPVTEMVTGLDLVEWQLHIASGGKLPHTQAELNCSGHAIEARIYAEDPEREFLPQTGILHCYRPPQSKHIRVDSGVTEGDEISIHYDPMISKVIAHAPTREQAIKALRKAVSEYVIVGCRTNARYIQSILAHQAFVSAELTTHFVEHHAKELVVEDPAQLRVMESILSLCVFEQAGATNKKPSLDIGVRKQFRLHGYGHTPIAISDNRFAQISLQQESALVVLDDAVTSFSQWHMQQNTFHAVSQGVVYRGYFYQSNNQRYLWCNGVSLDWPIPDSHLTGAEDQNDYTAPMNGTVVKVNAYDGQSVTAGATLMILEAMKMEHAIKATTDGIVTAVMCEVGQLVKGGQSLLEIEPHLDTKGDE